MPEYVELVAMESVDPSPPLPSPALGEGEEGGGG